MPGGPLPQEFPGGLRGGVVAELEADLADDAGALYDRGGLDLASAASKLTGFSTNRWIPLSAASLTSPVCRVGGRQT